LCLGAIEEDIVINKEFTTNNTQRSAGIYVDFLEQNTLGNNATNFYIRPSGSGEVRITRANSTSSYTDLRVRALWLEHSYGIANNSGNDFYIGTGGKELIISNTSFWNSGNPSYQDIRYMNARLHGHIGHHGTGGWFYIGAGRTNGVRFTDNNWGNG